MSCLKNSLFRMPVLQLLMFMQAVNQCYSTAYVILQNYRFSTSNHKLQHKGRKQEICFWVAQIAMTRSHSLLFGLSLLYAITSYTLLETLHVPCMLGLYIFMNIYQGFDKTHQIRINICQE